MKYESFKVLFWRIVPTGSWKTNPSCDNDMERLRFCFNLVLPNSSPRLTPGWKATVLHEVGWSCMDSIMVRRFQWEGLSWESGWSVGWRWVKLRALVLQPLWDLLIPWTWWGAEDSEDASRRKNISGAMWRASLLEWSQLLPWKPISRLLKVRRCSPGNVLPFLTSLYICHN